MDIKSVGNSLSVPSAYLNNGLSAPSVPPSQQNKAVALPVEPPAAIQQPEPNANIEQLNEALQNINKTMQSLSADLEFTVDADTGRTVVKVTDKATGELLRQMPSKEALEIAKALDRVEGLLIRQKA